jgi:hypothetical protein
MATASVVDPTTFDDVSLSVLIVVVVPIIDNDDVVDIDVVIGELVCCVVLLVVIVVDGTSVGGHMRGTQLALTTQMDGAVEQSCWVDVNSHHKPLECVSPGNWHHFVFATSLLELMRSNSNK